MLHGQILRADRNGLVACADIPLQKAVAGVRVGLLEGRGLVVNPTEQELQESSLDLMLAGTADALLMIEGYCDFLSEEQMVEVSFTILNCLGEAVAESLTALANDQYKIEFPHS